MDKVCTHALLEWGIVAYCCTPPHCVTFSVGICFNCIASAWFKSGKLYQWLLLWTKIQSNEHAYYRYYVKFLCVVHYCISYLMMWCINKFASYVTCFSVHVTYVYVIHKGIIIWHPLKSVYTHSCELCYIFNAIKFLSWFY